MPIEAWLNTAQERLWPMELEDLILAFPVVKSCEGFVATCAQQGFSAPFINTFEVYTFLVNFLAYLKSSVGVLNNALAFCFWRSFGTQPFQRADRQWGQHMKVLDTFLKAHLDKYYQHPQLTAFVVFLDSKEAWTAYKRDKYYDRVSEEQFIHRDLAQLDTTLERLDERGLSLHKVVDSSNFGLKGHHLRFLDENQRICKEYRELLLDFLTDPVRAGRYVLNGQRFATAALCCLQHVSVGQPSSRYVTYTLNASNLFYARL